MKCVNALFLLNTLSDIIIQLFFHRQHLCHHFITACTKTRNCSKSPTSKNVQRHNIYKTQQARNALKKWALFWSQKSLGSATICYGRSEFSKHAFFVWPNTLRSGGKKNQQLWTRRNYKHSDTFWMHLVEKMSPIWSAHKITLKVWSARRNGNLKTQ